MARPFQFFQIFLLSSLTTHLLAKSPEATKGNVLSLGQAILATKLPPDAVQELLNEAIRRGLAEVGNDPDTGPDTGAVRYYFDL